MAEDRFESRHVRVLLFWILLGLVGAGVAFKYFFRAFPEASVDFRVSRAAALEVARSFLTTQGHALGAYQSSIVFRVDDDAKIYLEREVGLEQANRLMAGEVSVWYWDIRFFRPGQKEEFEVRVSPAGRVAGMKHVIEEAREGGHLEREAARAAAEAFLLTRYHADLAGYNFLSEEANPVERPKRRDWKFTWERRGFRAPPKPDGAPYRIRVTVQGAQADNCEEFLKVPEAWLRDYERLRSSNLFYQTWGEVPLYFLIGAIIFVLILQARRGQVAWRAALKLGGVVALVFFAMEANQWPLTRFGYDTNSSPEGFFVQHMAVAALISLGLGLLVALAFAAGEPLYRRSQPDQLRLRRALSFPGLHSKEFFRSCVIGLAMASASIGYFVLFYVVGGKFGVWVPQEIKYTNVASTTFPWLAPLATSLVAATGEEFIFRLFAVHYIHKLTRSKVLAVLLPAFIWGFGHSLYPVEPGYTRGIEVGIIGIVAGLVMLRYGILTTLIWHYTVDASLIGLFLLRSENLYFRISGAIVALGVLIPLAVAGTSYFRRRRFEADPTLLNRAEPVVEAAAEAPAEAAEVTHGYEALAPRMLGILLTLGLAGVVFTMAVKPRVIGDFLRFRVDARQAAAKADAVLRQRKIEPATYKRATTLEETFNGYTNEYLCRQVGIAGANRLYEEKVPSAFWRVRYFRDSQKEEHAVVLRPDGALHSVHHAIEEKALGASLSKEEAQARAETYLRDEKKLDLGRWKLVEAKSEKRPGRTDHTFVWEELEPIGSPTTGADAAHVRTEVKVQGDEVSDYRVFIKLPEAWERRQQEKTLAFTIYFVGRTLFFVALGVIVLVIFFKNVKVVVGVPWRRLAQWSLWGLLASLASALSNVPLLVARYPTEMPFKIFAFILVVFMFLIEALMYSALFFLLGLAWFFTSRAFGAERLPSWRGMPMAYYRDAFWLALGGTGILFGFSRLPYLLARVWPTAHRTLEAHVVSGLDSYLPAAQAIGQAVGSMLTGGFFLIGYIALAAGLIAGYVRQRWMRFGLVLLLAVALAGEWGSPADFAKKTLVKLILLGVVWWGVTRVVRFNLLAYFLIIVASTLVGPAGVLLRQPNAFFRANGYAVAAALLVLLVWPLIAWLRSPSPGSSMARTSGPRG